MVQFLIMHFFLFYIIRGITLLNAINPCGFHMESCWVISYSLCSDVDTMLSRWSSWATTKEKMSKFHMESTWNMWGSVKSSKIPTFVIVKCESDIETGYSINIPLQTEKINHMH